MKRSGLALLLMLALVPSPSLGEQPDSLGTPAATDSLGTPAATDSAGIPAATDSLRTSTGTYPLASPPTDSIPTPVLFQDTLRIYSNLLGYQYQYGDAKGGVGFSGGGVKKIVRDNPEALASVKTFGSYHVPSVILACLSTLQILGGITGENWAAAGVGIGVMGIAVVIDRVGLSHLKKGVRVFNADPGRQPVRGSPWITVALKSGRSITARKVAPQALGIFRVEPVTGEVEYHDATQIRSVRNGFGQDLTEQVLDLGTTLTAP